MTKAKNQKNSRQCKNEYRTYNFCCTHDNPLSYQPKNLYLNQYSTHRISDTSILTENDTFETMRIVLQRLKMNRRLSMSDKKIPAPTDSSRLSPIRIKENQKVKKMGNADPEILAKAIREMLQKRDNV